MTTTEHKPLLFLGDWYVNSPVDCRAMLAPYRVVVNLEAPITQQTAPVPGKYVLRMAENYLEDSFGESLAAVCLSNNHILDYGQSGFLDTLHTLDTMSIPYIGAGTTAENHRNPLLLQCDAVQVGLLAYTCPSTYPVWQAGETGIAPIEPERIRQDIQRARGQGAERIAVVLHWGEERVHLPKAADVRIAHQLVDWGADVVVGHHAHVPQTVETYKGRPIAYGLGNFAFPDGVVPACDADGRVQTTYTVKKDTWQRTSFGLVWHVADNRWEMRQYRFVDDQRVEQGAFRDDAWFQRVDLREPDLARFEATYHRHVRARRLRESLRAVVENPSKLHPRHLRALVEIFGMR